MKNYTVTITYPNATDSVTVQVSALTIEGAATMASRMVGMKQDFTLYNNDTEVPETQEVVARFKVTELPSFYVHARERED